MSYKLFELVDMNRGGIYHDFTDGNEVRKSFWAYQPYYPPNDEPGFVNENFIKLVENRENYVIRKPIFSMFKLAEEFKNAVNNINEYVDKSSDSNKFFKNLKNLQDSLIEHGFYEGEKILVEKEKIDRLNFLFEKVLKIDNINENSEKLNSYFKNNPQDKKTYDSLLNEDGSSKFSTVITIGSDDFPPYNKKTTEPSISNNLDANRHLYTEDKELKDQTKTKIPEIVYEKLKNKFNFTKLEYIGSGYFGHAFDVGNNMVMKITTDKSEAVENANLINKKPEYIAQPYGVFVFRSKRIKKEFYVIVLEKLKIDNDLFTKKMNRLKHVFDEILDIGFHNVIDDLMFNEKLGYYEENKDEIDAFLNKNPQDKEFLNDLIKISNEAENLGVESRDFLNPQNLGYKKNGKLGFFDIGFGNPYKKPINEPEQYEIDERKKSYMPNSKEVKVKEKCRIGGLGNTSVACNQGDISNLEFSSVNEVTEPSGGYVAYHGSSHEINKFTDQFIGREEATDQEGPGIYFTTNYDDAFGYTEGGYIYTVRLTPRKLIDESSQNDIPREQIEKLISMAPNWEDNAMNWDEDPEVGLDIAIDNMYDYADNEKDLFQQIWYDFFRYQPKEYLRGMINLGYDGEIIEKENRRKHIIIFNPNVIEIIDIEKIKKEENINEEINKLGENKNISQLQDLPFKDDVYNSDGKIYTVGGSVRDEFLGKKSKDLDILITGIPMDKLYHIMSKYGKVDAVGKSFGILKFTPPEGEEIDVALPRAEKPTGDGGHKGFEIKTDHNLPIQDDLSRRDISINAIAKDINGNVIDPFSGMQDIQNKIIRVVNPQAFGDDPLRMLRSIQFAARFDFNIEPKTFKLIQNNAHRIKEISPERILIELEKIVNKGENIRKGVELLMKSGLYKNIFDIEPKKSILDRSKFEEVKTMGEFIYLLLKLHPNPADFYKENLKGDVDTYKEIKGIEVGMSDETNNPVKNRSTAHNIYKISPKALKSKLLPPYIQHVAREFEVGKYPKTIGELDIDGNDLKRFGLEGVEIGNTLKNLLIKVYADKVKNVRQNLIDSIEYKPSENLNEDKKSKYTKTKESLSRSRTIPDKMKEKIEKYLGGGSKYHDGGLILGLKKPQVKGKSFDGVSLGADKNGFFVYTHRSASKRYETPEKIPEKDIKFIESTG